MWYLYSYLLAGVISSLSVLMGTLVTGHSFTKPWRMTMYLALLWPYVLYASLKYLLFSK